MNVEKNELTLKYSGRNIFLEKVLQLYHFSIYLTRHICVI